MHSGLTDEQYSKAMGMIAYLRRMDQERNKREGRKRPRNPFFTDCFIYAERKTLSLGQYNRIELMYKEHKAKVKVK